MAFIYLGDIGDLGWTSRHDEGRIFAQEALIAQYPGIDVESWVYEFVPFAGAYETMAAASRQGADFIVSTSAAFTDQTIQAAADFPGTAFVHISDAHAGSDNSATAFARLYQGRYLGGVVAGGSSEGGVLGYVAPIPIPEVHRNVNAFLLGAQRAREGARVLLAWVGAFYDPPREREAGARLIALGAEVLTYHTDSREVPSLAHSHGLQSIGSNGDMRRIVGESVLTSVYANWGPVYLELADHAYNGTFRFPGGGNFWYGFEHDVCKTAALSFAVDSTTRQLHDSEKAGLLREDVFCGDLPNAPPAEGRAGRCQSDAQLLTMAWLLPGVTGIRGVGSEGAILLPGEVCPPGQRWEANVVPGATQFEIHCTVCPAGSASNWTSVELGATECTECEEGFYAPRNSSECLRCESGHRSTAGAAECTEIVSVKAWMVGGSVVGVALCCGGAGAAYMLKRSKDTKKKGVRDEAVLYVQGVGQMTVHIIDIATDALALWKLWVAGIALWKPYLMVFIVASVASVVAVFLSGKKVRDAARGGLADEDKAVLMYLDCQVAFALALLEDLPLGVLGAVAVVNNKLLDAFIIASLLMNACALGWKLHLMSEYPERRNILNAVRAMDTDSPTDSPTRRSLRFALLEQSQAKRSALDGYPGNDSYALHSSLDGQDSPGSPLTLGRPVDSLPQPSPGKGRGKANAESTLTSGPSVRALSGASPVLSGPSVALSTVDARTALSTASMSGADPMSVDEERDEAGATRSPPATLPRGPPSSRVHAGSPRQSSSGAAPPRRRRPGNPGMVVPGQQLAASPRKGSRQGTLCDPADASAPHHPHYDVQSPSSGRRPSDSARAPMARSVTGRASRGDDDGDVRTPLAPPRCDSAGASDTWAREPSRAVTGATAAVGRGREYPVPGSAAQTQPHGLSHGRRLPPMQLPPPTQDPGSPSRYDSRIPTDAALSCRAAAHSAGYGGGRGRRMTTADGASVTVRPVGGHNMSTSVNARSFALGGAGRLAGAAHAGASVPPPTSGYTRAAAPHMLGAQDQRPQGWGHAVASAFFGT